MKSLFLRAGVTCALLAAGLGACGSAGEDDGTSGTAPSGGSPTTGTGAPNGATTSGAGGATTSTTTGTSAGGATSSGTATSSATGMMPMYSIDETDPGWQQPAQKASLHFAPLDGMQAHVLAEMGRAQKSLRLAFFNIRSPEVIKLLAAKVKAGVDVKVLLDKKQQDLPYNTGFKDLTAAGVPVTLIENTSAMDATLHEKFTVVDGTRVLTGSANLSYTALNVSDEDLLTIESPALAARYQVEFDKLVAKGNQKSAPYNGEKVQAYFGPADGLATKVTAALDSAQKTAFVAMFALEHQGIVNSLVAAKKRGVTTVVVLDKAQADASPTSSATLIAAGIPVIKALNTGGMEAEMHSKFLVVDHKTTLMGSYNWSNLASNYNNENLLLLDDPVLSWRTEGKLAQLLDTYNAPPPAQLGLTTGKQTVTFKVANVTLDPGLKLRVRGEPGGPLDPAKELTNGSVSVTIDGGKRVAYLYEIVQGATVVNKEQGGKKFLHTVTIPYSPGPFDVFDAYQK
jgi:phosphatidylserine/phosphatidylglycerophosphate/cardiolipin synthase-like enzyme